MTSLPIADARWHTARSAALELDELARELERAAQHIEADSRLDWTAQVEPHAGDHPRAADAARERSSAAAHGVRALRLSALPTRHLRRRDSELAVMIRPGPSSH